MQKQNDSYRYIKDLVFDIIRRTKGLVDYETVTAEVKKHFPESKWKKTHWAWYRTQIKNGWFSHVFSDEMRANLTLGKTERQVSWPSKHYGKEAKYVIYAENSLVPDKVWGPKLRGYPTSLVCLIRAALTERLPSINEKFNSNSHYFGYRTGTDKDRAYIYVQKKKLVIDLCISPSFTKELMHLGFEVKPRDNFQGKAGWLTGWQVPKSTLNLEPVVKYLCKAFEG